MIVKQFAMVAATAACLLGVGAPSALAYELSPMAGPFNSEHKCKVAREEFRKKDDHWRWNISQCYRKGSGIRIWYYDVSK